MPNDNKFALFEDDGKGPLWREFFANLDEAKRRAQQLADDKGHECFVFCLTKYSEVARSFPPSGNHRPIQVDGSELSRSTQI
jgi:hypothetical protein